MKIGKYEFENQEQALTLIDELGVFIDEDGNKHSKHNHSVVTLGHILLEQGEYDEDGNETVAPVLSDKWHVDVLWENLEADEDGIIDHPHGWKSYAVNIDGDGVHGFLG